MVSPGALQSENYPVSSGFNIKALPVKTQHLTSTSEKKQPAPVTVFVGAGAPACTSAQGRAAKPGQSSSGQLSSQLGTSGDSTSLPWHCKVALQLTFSPGHSGALVGATRLEGAMHGVPSTPGRTSRPCREHPQRGSITPSPRLPQLSGPGEGRRDEMESAGLSR